jgi:predicted DNA-binding transcriptional regulator YafY
MARATAAQRAQRLNHARMLLQRGWSLSQAVRRLGKACSLSSRQAYRYIKQAQQLTMPVPVAPPKVAFTVKLPSSLVLKLRRHAARKRVTLSDIVSHALAVELDQGRGRG